MEEYDFSKLYKQDSSGNWVSCGGEVEALLASQRQEIVEKAELVEQGLFKEIDSIKNPSTKLANLLKNYIRGYKNHLLAELTQEGEICIKTNA
jgi:hypothetical protein